MKCRICNNENSNIEYDVRELFYGTKDTFRYFQCSECNCLQISEYPTDLSKYYPRNYYSYVKSTKSYKIKTFLNNLRNNYAIFGEGFVGKLLNTIRANCSFQILKPLTLRKDMKILEIGCGSGLFLRALSELGFKNLLGVDPFIEKDIEVGNGLKIIKSEIGDVKGEWDIIIFQHSFEHMPFQENTLQTVSSLLSSNGHCVISIPISSSYAWEHYGVNWVQLDAPRHFYLHSVKSMNYLATKAQLELCNITYNSNTLQFLGSEQYMKDISLLDKCSYRNGIKDSIFTKRQISDFTRQAKILNETQKGDQAIFYLRKP